MLRDETVTLDKTKLVTSTVETLSRGAMCVQNYGETKHFFWRVFKSSCTLKHVWGCSMRSWEHGEFSDHSSVACISARESLDHLEREREATGAFRCARW